MPPKHLNEQNDWDEYKRLVLDKLAKLDKIEETTSEIKSQLVVVDNLKERVATTEQTLNLHTYTLGKLRTKCSIWGTVAGFFGAALASALYFFGIK